MGVCVFVGFWDWGPVWQDLYKVWVSEDQGIGCKGGSIRDEGASDME